MPDINSLLKNYLDYLEIEKNRSPKTRENYERYLKAFIKFAKAKSENDITLDKVREFRLHLARAETKTGKDYEKTTQAYYIIALRNFLKYLNLLRILPQKILSLFLIAFLFGRIR